MKSKILIFSNSIRGLYNFRKELIKDLLSKYHLVIYVPYNDHTHFDSINAEIKEIKLSRRSTNVFIESLSLLEIFRIIKREKPEIVLTYTVKPNIYVGICRRFLYFKHIANITGLGYGFHTKNNFLKRTVSLLYKVAFKKTQKIFVQNRSNQELLLDRRLVSKNKLDLLPGSGVNLDEFKYHEYPSIENGINILYVSRISKEKGIFELFHLINTTTIEGLNINYTILGGIEDEIPEFEMIANLPNVQFLGYVTNVKDYYIKFHILVHPTHYEGMSNVILEMSAIGRPSVASDIPGCNDIITEDSGYLFEVMNQEDLVKKIRDFIQLPYTKMKTMGKKSRKIVESNFDRNIVIKRYKEEIELK